MIANVETGRFERALSALTAAAVLVTEAEIWLTDEKGRDAKLLAVPAHDPRYAQVRDLGDVPGRLLDEIGHFFDIYQELEPDKGTDVRGWQDRAAAEDVLTAARGQARQVIPRPRAGTTASCQGRRV